MEPGPDGLWLNTSTESATGYQSIKKIRELYYAKVTVEPWPAPQRTLPGKGFNTAREVGPGQDFSKIDSKFACARSAQNFCQNLPSQEPALQNLPTQEPAVGIRAWTVQVVVDVHSWCR